MARPVSTRRSRKRAYSRQTARPPTCVSWRQHFNASNLHRSRSRLSPVGASCSPGSQTSTDNAAAGSNVEARVFSSAGALGNVAQVNTLTGGNRFSLAAATTSGPAGDTAFLIWADDAVAGPDTSGRGDPGTGAADPGRRVLTGARHRRRLMEPQNSPTILPNIGGPSMLRALVAACLAAPLAFAARRRAGLARAHHQRDRAARRRQRQRHHRARRDGAGRQAARTDRRGGEPSRRGRHHRRQHGREGGARRLHDPRLRRARERACAAREAPLRLGERPDPGCFARPADPRDHLVARERLQDARRSDRRRARQSPAR